jgi:beta propeller repeat protein
MKTGTLVILCAVITATAWAGTTPPVLSGTEKPVAVKPGIQTDPAISGPYVVFTDISAGTADVWYFDATDNSLHVVANGAGNQLLSDVSGSRIVYTDKSSGSGEIFLYDIVSGTTTNLTNDAADESNPAVSTRLVAWEFFGAVDRDIVVRDLLVGTTTTITGAGDQSAPSSSGAKVAFLDGSAVKVYDADTMATSEVYAGPAASADIDGSHVAIALFNATDGDVAVYDISGAPLATLALAGDQGNPHISGEWVAFEDYSMGAAHVGLWHWTTGDVYYPTPTTSRQQLNDIDGNRIVYTDERSGDFDIYMFEFSVAGGGGGPDGDVNCSDTTFAALADFTVVRGDGKPTVGSADFNSDTDREVLVCIDANGVTSAWVTVDNAAVASPKDFKTDVTNLERRSAIRAGQNNVSAILAGKPGSLLRVRILPAATQQ